MKKILILLIPIMSLFKKRAYSSTHLGLSILLWVILGIPFYALSISTNMKAADAFFSQYPEVVQTVGKSLAFTIDPLIDILAIVGFLSYVVFMTIKDNGALKNVFSSYSKEKTIIERLSLSVTASMAVICIILTVVTLMFSHYGGGKWASRYADNHYKPIDKESRLKPFLDTKNKEQDAALRIYNSEKATLNTTLKRMKEYASKEREYARKKMWADYNKAVKASKWIDSGTYEREEKRIRNAYDKAKNEAKNAYDKERDEITASFNKEDQVYILEKNDLQEITTIGVNVWSIGSRVLTAIIMMLSYKEYQRHSVSFIHSWMNDIREDEQKNREQYPVIAEALENVSHSQSGDPTPLPDPASKTHTANNWADDKIKQLEEMQKASASHSQAQVESLTNTVIELRRVLEKDRTDRERERFLFEQKTFAMENEKREKTKNENVSSSQNEQKQDYQFFLEIAKNDVEILKNNWSGLGVGDMSLQNILDTFGRSGKGILHYNSKSSLHKVGRAIQDWVNDDVGVGEKDFFD